MPKLSFVVSAFNRPKMLAVALGSLAVQSEESFEAIVTDNSDDHHQLGNSLIVSCCDRRFRHIDSRKVDGSCYHTADWVVKNECRGDFICFPSDDSYYVPWFAQIMLESAERNNWDLVYCNMVYDARYNGSHYSVVNVLPKVNCIDKTGFILKRSWFEGFPGKVKSGPCKADGELIESLVARGIRHGKVPDVMVVHN